MSAAGFRAGAGMLNFTIPRAPAVRRPRDDAP